MEIILKNLVIPPGSDLKLKGLATIPAPTGFGKTFKTCEFLANNIDEILQRNIKIIFITPLLKNLPTSELEQVFKNAGQSHRFNETFLLLKNINDIFLEHLLEVEHQIPNELKTPALKFLIKSIKFLEKNNIKNQSLDSFGLREPFSQHERTFRTEIKTFLFDKGHSKQQKLKILSLPENQWVKKLYPSVEFDSKSIVMMSVRKFILPFVSLVDSSRPLAELLKPGTIVIMDEFDACKQTIQETIIESGLKHIYDPIRLVSQIHNHLHQQEPHRDFLKDSITREKFKLERNGNSIKDYHQYLKDRLKEVFTQFNLQFNLKSGGGELTRNFLFHDFSSFQIAQKILGISTDAENKINHIQPLTSQTENTIPLTYLMNSIQNLLQYLRQNITYTAKNYLENKNQSRNPGIDEMLLEHALKTVLNEFGIPLNSGFAERFFDASLQYEYNIRFKKTEFLGLKSFYDQGFSYFQLEDHPEHDTYTATKHYVFYDTPESYLFYLCDKVRVIGLSATADMQTPLRNFDLNYLRSRLGKNFLDLSHQDVTRLKEAFKRTTQGYDKVEINVDFLPDLVDFQADLEALIGGTEFVEELMDKLSEDLNLDSDNNYYLQRYLNLFRCLIEFIDTPRLYAYLALFLPLANPDNANFNSTLIQQFFNAYTQAKKTSEDLALCILTGSNYETHLLDIKKQLSSGKRVFVLSSYATVGAGQNLQYKIPPKRQTIIINDRTPSAYMDFNAIYLDTITNIIPDPGSLYTEKSMIDRLFKIEYLAEAGDISHEDKMKQIKYSLASPSRLYPPSKLSGTQSYINATGSIFIQAIGRICRTNQKAQTIYIRLNKGFKEKLATLILPESMPKLVEFEAVLTQCGRTNNPHELIIEQAIQKAENKNFKAYKTINSLMNNITNPNNIQRWKDLRELCLTHPCFEQETEVSTYFETAYLKLPNPQLQYWYQNKDNDFKHVQISFHYQPNMASSLEIDSTLQKLMELKGLKKYFKTKGWMTELKKASYWLVPVMFNNIYKGALGEEIGRYIFEQKLGITLNELPNDIYETFDFVLENGVYIDFKFWINYKTNATQYKAKTQEKLNKIGGKTVLMINVAGNSNHSPINCNSPIIEIPSLVYQGEINPLARAEIQKIASITQ